MTPDEREQEWTRIINQATRRFHAVRDARELARQSVRDLPTAPDALVEATRTAYLLALDIALAQASDEMFAANADAAAWWNETHPDTV